MLDGTASEAGQHRHLVSHHSHQVGWTITDSDGSYSYRGNKPNLDGAPGVDVVYSGYDPAHRHHYTAVATLRGGDFDMRPDNYALMFIIRASNP